MHALSCISLGRKLSAVGFEMEDIQQALQWLDGLNIASHQTELIDITSIDT